MRVHTAAGSLADIRAESSLPRQLHADPYVRAVLSKTQNFARPERLSDRGISLPLMIAAAVLHAASAVTPLTMQELTAIEVCA